MHKYICKDYCLFYLFAEPFIFMRLSLRCIANCDTIHKTGDVLFCFCSSLLMLLHVGSARTDVLWCTLVRTSFQNLDLMRRNIHRGEKIYGRWCTQNSAWHRIMATLQKILTLGALLEFWSWNNSYLSSVLYEGEDFYSPVQNINL